MADEALDAISRAHGALHLGDHDGVDAALEAARTALLEAEAAAPRSGGGLDRDALADALWETTDAAEEGSYLDATPDQRATTEAWADAILARLRENTNA